MHELSIAEDLFRLCEQRLLPTQRLQLVRTAIGELASIEPDLLQFAWQAVIAGTRHAGAVLEIVWHAARQSCADCGQIAERQPGSWMRLCPRCRSPLQVSGGDELDLVAVIPVPLVAVPQPGNVEVSS